MPALRTKQIASAANSLPLPLMSLNSNIDQTSTLNYLGSGISYATENDQTVNTKEYLGR
jgi:hypothetical protein